MSCRTKNDWAISENNAKHASLPRRSSLPDCPAYKEKYQDKRLICDEGNVPQVTAELAYEKAAEGFPDSA
jgi:hypothetical protein